VILPRVFYQQTNMIEYVFEAIYELLKKLVLFIIILFPLAIWKLIDIIIWLYNYIITM
jgi:hypothetical protein